ncbi:MAG: hypothetical protein KIG67_03400 [Bacteroidales bacterium]|nr:hypothetical protein [Bacteroidales bacterium]
MDIRACPAGAFSFPTLCRLLRHLPSRENAACAFSSGRWLRCFNFLAEVSLTLRHGG